MNHTQGYLMFVCRINKDGVSETAPLDAVELDDFSRGENCSYFNAFYVHEDGRIVPEITKAGKNEDPQQFDEYTQQFQKQLADADYWNEEIEMEFVNTGDGTVQTGRGTRRAAQNLADSMAAFREAVQSFEEGRTTKAEFQQFLADRGLSLEAHEATLKDFAHIPASVVEMRPATSFIN
jgi:hypothetical protein